MPKLTDYLRGIVIEYAEPLRDAAIGELNAALEQADAALRDPKKVRKLVRSIGAGVVESWRKCPHGSESEAVCDKCNPKE